MVTTRFEPSDWSPAWQSTATPRLTFKRDALSREITRETAGGFQLTSAYDSVGQLIRQKGVRAEDGSLDPGDKVLAIGTSRNIWFGCAGQLNSLDLTPGGLLLPVRRIKRRIA